jgi:hypothetical protein
MELESLRTRMRIRLDGHALVGRHERCNVRLPNPCVSSEHAAIGWTGREWCVRDLGSRNGTYIDGERIPPGERRPVHRGMTLAFGIADHAWLLVADDAPDDARTSSVTITAESSEELRLRFVVSPDEETVEVAILGVSPAITLPERSYHYLLLTLARTRLDDQRVPGLDVREHGWQCVDDVAKAMGTNLETLNVHIHRLRKQFADLGVSGVSEIIERRVVARQIRIAVPSIQVVNVRVRAS